jgi:adenine-specific DNA-methyltransferase
MDLWYLFVCYGFNLLKADTGILAIIATNNWTTNTGASKLRNKIIETATIKQLVDFNNYMIFETADVQSMIMIFQNRRADNYQFEYRRLIAEKPHFDDINDLLQGDKTKNNEIIYPIINKDLINKPLTFSAINSDIVLEKIKLNANFLLTKDEIANGIHPHYDYVNKNSQKILGSPFKVGQGIFVLSDAEKQALNLNQQELALIKPYYTTAQLSRWFANANNSEWIIYTGSSFSEADNIKPYPSIKNHLDKFQNVITSDNKPYGLHRARKERFFKGEKIIVLRKCVNQPVFTYTDFDCYVSATFYVIKSERINLLYLTTLLNSKLMAFWLKHKGKMQGNNYQLDKEPLLALPLYQTDNMQCFIDKAIIMLNQNQALQKLKGEFLDFLQADLSIKKLNTKLQHYEQLNWAEFKAELLKLKINLIERSSKGNDLEVVWFKRFEDSKTQVLAIKPIIEQTDKAIDAMVYQLYGLNEDDIALIEKSI